MDFVEEKIKKPFIQQVKSGASPQKLSLSLAVGIICGIFPIPGLTTIPVLITTFCFRLNPAITMIVNYICTPLNFASFPIFIVYGNKFFTSSGNTFSMANLMDGLKKDTIQTVSKFQGIIYNGILLWAFIAPFVSVFLYILFLPFIQYAVNTIKIQKQSKTQDPSKKRI